jgi:tetratricopeptide (TPR) repeat protein
MSSDTSRNLALAAHFLIIERPERALTVLGTTSPDERESRRYWSLLAEAYAQQAQDERAREALLAGLALFPEDIGLLRQLASACRQLKAYDSAESALANARRRQPDNANLAFDSAYLAWHAGAYDSAEKRLAQASALAPESQHIPRLRALIAHGRKRWSEAEQHARAWLVQDPENGSAHYFLGDILSRQGRNLEAKESVSRAAQLDAASGAAADLRRVERQQSGCIGAIMLLAISGGVLMTVIGLLAYLIDGVIGGLILLPFSGALTGLLAYFLIAGRRPVRLSATALTIGSGERQQHIAYDDITDLRNGQLGIAVQTAQRRYRLYRIDQKEQAQLFVDLRNRVPQTYQRLLAKLQTPLPFTVWGNWYSGLAMVALLGAGLLLLYALTYNFVIEGNRDWGITLFMGASALFVAVLAVWRLSELPLWVRCSAESICVRTLFKRRCYAADQLAHVGLRRGYRIFKGRQLPDYKVELHFADGDVLRLGEGEVRHPPDDWSPLYELAARLQVQYGVSAPRYEPGQIGRFIV